MNRESVKRIAYNVTKPFSFQFLRNVTGQHFVFPFYHFIGDNYPPYVRHLYRQIKPREFLDDLEFLLKHYQPATVDDLKRFSADGKKSNKPLFLLSFDDGLKECYEVVFPVLKQKGIQAAFFVNSGFADNKALFYRFKISLLIEKAISRAGKTSLNKLTDYLGIVNLKEDELAGKLLQLKYSDTQKLETIAHILNAGFDEILNAEKPYMSMEQLKKLNSEGFLIGAHSVDHPLFSDLSEAEQISQVSQSMDFVNNHFKPELSLFAFPFTDFGVSPRVFDFIEHSDDIDFSFGTAGIKKDSRQKHIQRIPMDEFSTSGSQKILRAEYAYYLFKSMFGKNKIRR